MHHSSALQFSDLISQALVVSSLISNINWTMASAAIVEKAAVIMLVLTLTMGHLMANASPQQPRRLLAIAEEESEVPGKPASLPVLPADAAAAVENRLGDPCPPGCFPLPSYPQIDLSLQTSWFVRWPLDLFLLSSPTNICACPVWFGCDDGPRINWLNICKYVAQAV